MNRIAPIQTSSYAPQTPRFGAVQFGDGGKALSLRDLERVLADRDFVELDGRNKKHRIFRGPHAETGNDVNVSLSHGKGSKDVPPGTLRQIARDMGITLRDLLGR